MAIKSDNIKLFPSSLRTLKPQGKFTSEENLTGMIRTTTDADSYVIELSNNKSRFVIHGYYFEYNGELTDIIGQTAYIKVEKNGGRLVGPNGETELDSGDNFIGLTIGSSPSYSENYNIYSLLLSTENIKKFNIDSVSGVEYSEIGLDDLQRKLNIGSNIEIDSNNKISVVTTNESRIEFSNKSKESDNSAVAERLAYTQGQEKIGDTNNPVYFNNGKPVAGIKINYGTLPPTSSTPGNQGDLYFVYSETE